MEKMSQGEPYRELYEQVIMSYSILKAVMFVLDVH